MTDKERESLKNDLARIEQRLKKDDIPSPKDVRRRDEIRSLLLTDGKCNDLILKVGKPRNSERVSSFTRDRR